MCVYYIYICIYNTHTHTYMRDERKVNGSLLARCVLSACGDSPKPVLGELKKDQLQEACSLKWMKSQLSGSLLGRDSTTATLAFQGMGLCQTSVPLTVASLQRQLSLAWVLCIPRVCGTICAFYDTRCPTGTLSHLISRSYFDNLPQILYLTHP